MSNLLYFKTSSLYPLKEQVPGLENFLKIQKFSHINVGIKDRTGTLTIPFRNKIFSPLPVFDPDFNLSYKDCMLDRMKDLDHIHNTTGKTFRLLYSGGIDTTAILAAFIEYYGLKRSSELLELCCSIESMHENPWAWDRYIRSGDFRLRSSHAHNFGWSDNVVTVMGEGNDQLFGGVVNAKWCVYQSRFKRNIYCKPNNNILTNFFRWLNPDCNNEEARLYSKTMLQLAEVSPVPVSNVHALIWWTKFVLDWDNIMLRVLAHATHTKFSEDLLDNGLIQFFNSKLFQQWGLKYHNDYPDCYAESKYYKHKCKQAILDILDIPEYADKNKFISFPRVHSMTSTGLYIDDQLEMGHRAEDFLKFIEPNNSFI
jgi:hypothetical protein